MAFVKADRVQERSTTTGTGNIELSGAYDVSFRTFGTNMVDADTCQALCINEVTGEWEVFEGTYVASGNELARSSLISSSTGSTVAFGSGVKRVAMLPPASKSIVADNDGDVSFRTGDSGQFPAWPEDPNSPNTSEENVNPASPAVLIPSVAFGPTKEWGISSTGTANLTIIGDNNRAITVWNRSSTQQGLYNTPSCNIAQTIPGRTGNYGSFRIQGYTNNAILQWSNNGSDQPRITVAGGANSYTTGDPDAGITLFLYRAVVGSDDYSGEYVFSNGQYAVINDTTIDLIQEVYTGGTVSVTEGWIAHFVTPASIRGTTTSMTPGQAAAEWHHFANIAGVSTEHMVVGAGKINVAANIFVNLVEGGSLSAPVFRIGNSTTSGMYRPAADRIAFVNAGVPTMVLSNANKVVISPVITQTPTSNGQLEVSTDLKPAQFGNFANNAGTNALFTLTHSRGSASGNTYGHLAVQNNDVLHTIQWGGDDGTSFRVIAASISGQVDGAVATAQVPGRLVFSTADSGGTLRTALTISATQAVQASKGIGTVAKTIASLGTPTAGMRDMVTNSNATLAAGLGNIVASGGSNIVPVYADGTNWRIG